MAALAVISLFFLWLVTKGEAVRNNLEQSSLKGALKEQPAPYKINDFIQLHRRDYLESIPAQGKINGTQIDLRFGIEGVLEKFQIKPGTAVRKGEILGRLNNSEALLKVRHRQARLDILKKEMELCALKQERAQKFYETGYFSKLKLRETELEKDKKEREISAAQLEMASAQMEYEKTLLKAPIDGVISNTNVSKGELVSESEVAASLVSADELFLELQVAESYIGKIKTGQNVKIKTHPHEDLIFSGIVEGVVPFVSGRSRTLTVKVSLNPSEINLLPGMYVRAQIVLYERKKAILVPRSALSGVNDPAEVIVLNEEGKKTTRSVKCGYAAEDEVVVLKGLEEGEKVLMHYAGAHLP